MSDNADIVREALEWVGDTPHDIVDTRKLKTDAFAALEAMEARERALVAAEWIRESWRREYRDV